MVIRDHPTAPGGRLAQVGCIGRPGDEHEERSPPAGAGIEPVELRHLSTGGPLSVSQLRLAAAGPRSEIRLRGTRDDDRVCATCDPGGPDMTTRSVQAPAAATHPMR